MQTELTTLNPRGNLETAMEICSLIKARTDEIMASIAGVEVTAENWNDPQTKATIDDLADAVEDLRGRGKKLVADVCAASEAQRVLTTIDARLWNYSTKVDPLSSYGRLSAALKALKAKVAEFKDAATPKEPPRAWVVRMDMDGDQFKAMAKYAEKQGCPFQQFAVPQGDKAVKQIAKWFEENV